VCGVVSSYSGFTEMLAGIKPCSLLSGVVCFVSSKETFKTALQVYLHGHDHLSGHPSGIRCSVSARGRMIITADHVDGVAQVSLCIHAHNMFASMQNVPAKNISIGYGYIFYLGF